MKGFKAFDKNLKCREVQFEVGQIYKTTGEVVLCKNGFHFCEQLKDVYNYYSKNYDTRICMVEALGDVKTEGDKSCTSKIQIIAELDKDEIRRLTDDLRFNSGKRNSGYGNSGYGNSGDGNSGNWNSGNRNSGYGNSGYGNSGYGNSGDGNSGNWNSGKRNSGYGNSGDGNSGNWNSGNRNSGYGNSGDGNSGYLNTKLPKVRLFNKDTELDENSEILVKFRSILNSKWKEHLVYVYSESMTEQEKKDHPYHITTGGFIRRDTEYTYKKSWERVWNICSEDEKQLFKSLPNFDAVIFQEITGINIEDMVTVTINGKDKKIKREDAIKLGLLP